MKKCNHCGKLIEETNYDRFKQYMEGEIDSEKYIDKRCGGKCPFRKAKRCDYDQECLVNIYEDWLRKKAIGGGGN